MNKFVLAILIALSSVPSYAQIRRSVEFDFSRPVGLNPSITPVRDNGGEYNVTNKVFHNDKVSVDFELGNQGLGTAIQTFVNIYTEETTYFLKVCQQAYMKIHVPNDCNVDAVTFASGSVVGDLRVVDESLGVQENGYKKWICNKDIKVHDLAYKNSFTPANLTKVIVDYTIPSEVLKPTTEFVNGSKVSSFDSLVICFDDTVKVNDASKITLSDGENTWQLTPVIKGRKVVLAASEKMEAEGNYTLLVPAKSFFDKEGFENVEAKYEFKIVNPFMFAQVSPVEGEVKAVPMVVTLNYDKLVGAVDEEASIRLYKNGEPYLPVKAKKVSDTEVELSVQNIEDPVTTKGVYTFEIPAGIIFNQWKGDAELERSNEAFELEYVIDDSKVVKEAKAMLEKSGVGYPLQTSDSYVALAALFADGNEPVDDDVVKALEAYYTEANVALPENEKWYVVANVNADGDMLYIACKDDALSFVKDASEAAPFEALVEDEGTVLRTVKGSDLTLAGLVPDGEGAEKILTIKKIDATVAKGDEGVTLEPKQLLGYMGIVGKCKNLAGDYADAFATLNHLNGVYASDASVTSPYLKKVLSSAFIFSEVDKPSVAIETVETAYKLTPSVAVSANDMLTLEFEGISNVRIAKDAAAYVVLASAPKDKVKDVQLVAVGGATNKFSIALKGLEKNDYNLVISEGAFLYEKDGKNVKTQAISQNFSIGINGTPDDTRIDFSYSNYQYSPDNMVYICDTVLNYVLIKDAGYYDGLVANPLVEVRLVYYDNDKLIRSGHMESYVDPNESEVTTLRFVFDEPIRKGELVKGQYAVVFGKGAFGDRNYGKFLNDKTSVNPSDCKACDRSLIPFDVDNVIATGIDGVAAEDAVPVIYTVTGVKLNSIDAPGIYIVNGKTVVVK